MGTTQKGNYYRLRTKKWLEQNEYLVENLEKSYRVYDKKKDRVIFIKRDIWGADLIARNKDFILFVQVKSNKGDIAKGVAELSKGPWPANVMRIVVHWPQGRRLEVGPDIVEVNGCDGEG